MTIDLPADQVRRFAAFLAGTDIEQLELRTARGVLCVRRGGACGGIAAPPADPAAASHAVTAPSPGVFLHRHPMHDAPLAPVGGAVARGQIVGFLRIGLLLLAVPAPRGGTVTKVAAAHGETVGYGATLLRLRGL
jgi:acetyl-CoA carboxylase biotin carboxyl carrier protein